MRPVKAALLVLLLIALAAAARAPEFAAQPATAGVVLNLTVDSNADDSDASPGDTECNTGLFLGECTLRAAIEEINAGPFPGSTIDFNITGSPSILVSPELPAVTVPVTIDATTECSGFQCVRLVGGNGANNGFRLQGGSSTVRGFAIVLFDEAGILIETAGGNLIAGNYIGTSNGTNPSANVYGVHDQSPGGNTIGGATAADRNVISGNSSIGIFLDETATGTTILGNYIGTSATGLAALGNGNHGVLVSGEGNVVGGTNINGLNIISGNGGNGVAIGASSNIVRGNHIGVNLNGAVVGNGGNGVEITDGTANQVVTSSNAIQVIAGNTFDGVKISGANTANSQVLATLIGTNGLADLGNGGSGVHILDGAHNITVTAGTISGNQQFGVLVEGVTSINNTVQNAFIGTNESGSGDVGNTLAGVNVTSATGTLISSNTISGNDAQGILINNANGNSIIANRIGTNSAGDTPLANTGDGIAIVGNMNMVDGSAGANIISANGGNGVYISGNQNSVKHNTIGLNAARTVDLGNSMHGVLVSSGTGNLIGALGSFQTISGNGGDGVRLEGGSTTNTILDVNSIGLNGSSNASIGNSGNGVTVRNGAHDNQVGNNIGNGIAGNTGSGVRIEGATTVNNILHHNNIGNAGGATALPNGANGVVMTGTGANTIGDDTFYQNVISGNTGHGVLIQNSTGVNARGSRIGTTSDGSATLGNSLAGIQIENSTNSVIGGSTSGARNTISGNGASGVVIQGASSTGNKVEGNYIGTDGTGGSGLGNGTGSGVALFLSASNNTIGGTTAAQGNLISGHFYAGVFASSAASNNTISANRIGTNAMGTGSVGNTFGILVDGAANNIVIGGATDAEGNLISGNSIRGVHLGGVGAWLRRNKIGTNAAGTAAVPNGVGVYINTLGDGLNTIGGFGSPNTIAFNTTKGVEVDGSLRNGIRVNSIHSNGGVGIDDLNGGNTEIAPPVITTINATTIAGTSTCANCAVDIFSDDEDEGRTFFAAVTTNGAGAWSILGGVPGATNLTTTVTSAAGNTSEFSSPKPYDTDGDGVVNGLPNPIDNCSGVPNVNQLNTDAAAQATPSFPDDVTIANSDALGDACDVDDDNDGIIDGLEYDACAADLDPLKMDTDGDRTMDQAECDLGTNPNDAFSKPPAVPAGDTDGDGLPSSLEAGLGSNPSVADTDGDGVSDGIEYRGYHSSPTLTNTDGDACADDVEIASVDTNTVVNAIDLLNIALQFQRTDRPVQDLSKNGVVNSLDLLIAALNFNALPC